MFVDKVRIYAKAGNGGNGCVSFRREQFIDMGGPNAVPIAILLITGPILIPLFLALRTNG